MTLRARLALGFLTITLLLAVPLAASLAALRDARLAVERIRRQPFAASIVVSKMRGTSSTLRKSETAVYVSRGTDSVYVDSLRSATRTLGQLADSLDQLARYGAARKAERSQAAFFRTLDR